ncbi:MAG: 2-isopropylmalate synthase [Dehalococcoidia bacterium]|nr:2-isopropylmalate synthase [Dehalococcoidia bacterium]
MKTDKVLIFDTTLRDGEQAAGTSLNVQEKLDIARQLEKLGVDIIEAGFPITSQGDFDAVRIISKEIRNSTICALSHANDEAVDRAWEAVKKANKGMIHIFLSTSGVHLTHQLKKSQDEILKMAVKAVARARKYTSNIEFSPMDATRTDPKFLYRIVEAVIDAGAISVNIPDTVGYSIPSEFGKLIEGIFKNVPNMSKARISVHCHNDLGLAVANSLEAVRKGARQIECTINGIGERAGNAAMEEIVMAIKTRSDLYHVTTNVDTSQIFKTSKMVSDLTGFLVQQNKAIVGANAFRHQSGIHQDGIIKKANTYEIMNPRDVGVPSSALVLGKVSGRHAFKERLAEMGYSLDEEALNHAFKAFKDLADKKRKITDRDIQSLIGEEIRTASEVYHLDHVGVSCGNHSMPTATVRLIGPNKEIFADAALGSGPVDAVYKAINRIVRVRNVLTEFTVSSITEGIDAMGEVLIRIESDSVTYSGRGVDTDIIVASAKAYMNALNRLLNARKTASREAT